MSGTMLHHILFKLEFLGSDHSNAPSDFAIKTVHGQQKISPSIRMSENPLFCSRFYRYPTTAH